MTSLNFLAALFLSPLYLSGWNLDWLDIHKGGELKIQKSKNRESTLNERVRIGFRPPPLPHSHSDLFLPSSSRLIKYKADKEEVPGKVNLAPHPPFRVLHLIPIADMGG